MEVQLEHDLNGYVQKMLEKEFKKEKENRYEEKKRQGTKVPANTHLTIGLKHNEQFRPNLTLL